MKAGELRPCALCGKGLLHAGVPLFWRVSLRRFGADLAAVRRVAGLEMLLGSVPLARALGPDPDIAAPLGEERTVLVCEACTGDAVSVYRLGLPE